MDSENRAELKQQRHKALRRTGLLLAALVLVAAIPVSAWLSSQRKLAAVATIFSPVSIDLYAGHGEDHRYININAIDLSKGTVDGGYRYMDFPFGIRSNRDEFYLQLAHTTNNPFEYEIYYATETSSVTDVAYLTHDDPAQTWYYTRSNTQIQGSYQNRAAAYDANDTGDWHDATYGETETRVQTHAEPLYWHSTNPVEWGGDAETIRYFILRVKWPSTYTANTRETDILYITAEVATAT